MKRRMHPPLYILSILVLLFIAVLCMPSHVQAAASDTDKNPTIAADGFEIVGTPTNRAGPSMYAHVRQEAFEANPGWFEIRETVPPTTGAAGWDDRAKRAQAQMALAEVVDASTGYSKVEWANARDAQHYGPGEQIRIRVKFTKPVIIHQDTKLRITLRGFAYMDIDTTVHDDPLVAPTDLPGSGRQNLRTVYHWSVDENDAVSQTASDNLYVTFTYTVQDGDFTPEGIRMPAWDDPLYRQDQSGGYLRIGSQPTVSDYGPRSVIPTDNGWSSYVPLNSSKVRGQVTAGTADTGTAANGDYEGAFVWPVDVADPGQRPFTYLGESLPYKRLNLNGVNVYLYSVDTFSADTVVAQIVDGIGARHDPLDTTHPTIGDAVAEQTGAFEIEIKFANYVTGSRYAEQPQSNTFGADKILIDGDDVERDDWTISGADFYAVDAVATAAAGVNDPFAGELKHSTPYAVYRATITPPANFDGDVAISIAEGAITDLAGNTSKASADALTVPVNTITDVTIPDEMLLAKIKEELGIAAGTVVPQADMLRLTSLDLSGLDVSDLTGLEFATNLEELDLSDTEVLDISALLTLTSLVELSLSGTPVSDITPLSDLTNLKVLDLSDTQVSDISALSK